MGSDREDPVEAIAVWPEETLVQVSDYLWLSVSCSLCFPSPAIDSVSNRTHPRLSPIISFIRLDDHLLSCAARVAPVRGLSAPD